jgi:hypothetical protein
VRPGLRDERHPPQENIKADWSEQVDRHGVRTIVRGHDDGAEESAAVSGQIPTLEMEARLVNGPDSLHLVEPLLDGEVVGHRHMVRTADGVQSLPVHS